MARGQRPVKGFRPGKEPPELRKRRAKEQFGDVNALQERLIEVFAERSPAESRQLISRWTTGLLVAALVVAVAAAILVLWSTIAAIITGLIAVLLGIMWWRIRSQRADLEAMADAVSGPGRRGR